MVTCNNCFHCCVCPIADGVEYADEQHIRDDCEYFVDTADVVPKSEVEVLQGALKAEEQHNELTMEMAKKALANAKAEVAREIFEEIDKIFNDYKLSEHGLRLIQHREPSIDQRYAELKKKYTEGKE